MEKFFSAQSVAVFGVSDAPGNLGRFIIDNMKRFDYTGRIYPVGRTATEVVGIPVYRQIEDVPEVPDLAVLLVPARAMPGIIEACGKKGIRHAIIEAAGFSELGSDKKELEEEILRMAGSVGLRFIGPNCVGIINKETGLCTPFIPFERDEFRVGGNSFITQSGGLVHDVIHRCAAENLGLSKVVSIGNKLMIDENDVLEYLLTDKGTNAIGVYLETISNGRRLMELASTAEKPVILLDGNRSPSSREIASFHTAALAGDAAVAAAACRQAGIHQVDNIQDMIDCFKIFEMPLLKGPNLAIICRSGGQSVLLADDAHRHNFRLPPLPPEFFEKINERTKAGVIRNTNPIDLGDVWDDLFYADVVEMAAARRDVDGVILYFEYGVNHEVTFEILKGVERVSRTYDKPAVLCMVPDRSVWLTLRYSRDFPFFTESERALRALRRSLDHFTRITGERRSAFAPAGNPGRSLSPGAKQRVLATEETLRLAGEYAIPLCPYEMGNSRTEVLEAARRLGYPVALKRVEPAVLHKTEAGAVRLDIMDDKALEEAMEEMPAEVYLVQKMAPEGVETIIGGKRDAQFGPVVVFGLGGIFVEVLKDVTMRVAPVDEVIAAQIIGEIRGAPLLKGARGRTPADTPALVQTIARVSQLLVDHPEIARLDINPFRVFGQGQGALALDIKMEKDEGWPAPEERGIRS